MIYSTKIKNFKSVYTTYFVVQLFYLCRRKEENNEIFFLGITKLIVFLIKFKKNEQYRR